MKTKKTYKQKILDFIKIKCGNGDSCTVALSEIADYSKCKSNTIFYSIKRSKEIVCVFEKVGANRYCKETILFIKLKKQNSILDSIASIPISSDDIAMTQRQHSDDNLICSETIDTIEVIPIEISSDDIAMTQRQHSDDKNKKEYNSTLQRQNKKLEIIVPPPPLEECVNFFLEKGFSAQLGTRAWNYYESSKPKWHDSKGKPIKNWKMKMIAVWMTEKNMPQKKHEKTREEINIWDLEIDITE